MGGMSGVCAVAMRLERRPRRVKRLYGPAQVTRHECNLGLGDDAPRAGDGLLRTKGAGSAPQQLFGTRELAELGHCDATQRERGCVVTQRYAFQGPQRIARRERPRRSRNQRVHRNPVTVVTLTRRSSRPKDALGSFTAGNGQNYAEG
jgi:hypothetical protein